MSLPGADGYLYFGEAKNLPKVRELLQKEVHVTVKSNLKEFNKKIDNVYLGLVKTGDGSREAEELERIEKAEREAELRMRDDQAGLLLQEKFMAKKRKRIELMQSREKEVVFGDLTVN